MTLRRHFIISSGLLFLAGCSTTQPEPTTTTQTGDDMETTTTATETQTTTQTQTATSTPTETATPTETPTETATPTETETPEANEEAREALSQGEFHLAEAIEIYTDFGNGILILNVDAATESFVWTRVGNKVRESWEALDTADREGTESQRERSAQLRDVGEFVRYAAQCQDRVITAYKQTVRAKDGIYQLDTTDFNSGLNQQRDAVESAEAILETIDSETNPDSTLATDAISRSEYEQKVAQFEAELAISQALVAPLRTFDDIMETYEDGVDSLFANEYGPAESDFEEVIEDLETLADEFAELARPPSFDSLVTELETVADVLLSAARDLRDSADAGSNDPSARDDALEDAQATLSANATVAELAVAETVIESSF